MSAAADDILTPDSIRLRGRAKDQDTAIEEAGDLLVAVGAVDRDYVAAMHDRERTVSTYMGEGLAIPHGTNEAKAHIHSTALSFVHYPDGIDWAGNRVEFVVGIAGADDQHLELLADIATVFLDPDAVARLRAAGTASEVIELLRTED